MVCAIHNLCCQRVCPLPVRLAQTLRPVRIATWATGPGQGSLLAKTEGVHLVLAGRVEGEATSRTLDYLGRGAVVGAPLLLMREGSVAGVTGLVVPKVRRDTWQILPVLVLRDGGIAVHSGCEVLELHRGEVDACIVKELQRDVRAWAKLQSFSNV